MASPPLHDVLSALALALREFHQAADGDPRRQIAAVGAAQGTVPTLIRSVLAAIHTALSALRTAMAEGEKFLIQADGMLAFLGVSAQALSGILNAVTEAAGGLGADLDLTALKEAGNALQPISEFLNKASVLDDGLLPSPDDLRLVRHELRQVLGSEPGEPNPTDGSLGLILKSLGTNP